jgi:hypothetical protein
MLQTQSLVGFEVTESRILSFKMQYITYFITYQEVLECGTSLSGLS